MKTVPRTKGHHFTGFVVGNPAARSLCAISDTGVRISLGIVVLLFLIFAVTVQKSARSISRENAALIEQLHQVEADRIRLKSELERALAEVERTR